MDKEIIEKILGEIIAKDEQLGESSGGSEHLSNTTFAIDDIKISEMEEDVFYITYCYSIYIETEFTYYPDNPPYEYSYQKTIQLDSDYKLIGQGEKVAFGRDVNENWLKIQSEINSYLLHILSRIEWYYGDNRAPFVYPPTYEFLNLPFAEEYKCILKGDEGYDDTEFVFKACKAEQLVIRVKENLSQFIDLDFMKDVE